MRCSLEYVGQRAVDNALLQHVGIHHQVQQRAFDDGVAAPFDEAERAKLPQVHVHAGFLADFVAEIGQQRLVGNADRRVLRPWQRLVLAEHVVLVLLGMLMRFLPLAFGQDDQRPQHDEQRNAVARQSEIIVLPDIARAEDSRLDLARQRQCHVVSIDIVEQLQAAGSKAGVEIGAKQFIRQGTLDQLVVAPQGLMRQ